MLFENPVAAAKMFPYSVPPPIQGAAAVPVQNLRFVDFSEKKCFVFVYFPFFMSNTHTLILILPNTNQFIEG